MQGVRAVNLYLTKEVCEYLGQTTPDFGPTDVVITEVDDCGGIFIHQAGSVGDEGSGVWVDASGREHLGPSEGEFKESIDAIHFHRGLVIGDD